MKKIILGITIFVFTTNLKAQTNIYDEYKDLDAAYLPDENVTYFMEKFEVSSTSEGADLITFINIKAKVEGNVIDYIAESHPNSKPIVKGEKHREEFEVLPNEYRFACIKGGTLCVILLGKNQYDNAY